MRSDLSQACLECSLRLPVDEQRCPRCGGGLVAARHALEPDDRSGWRRLVSPRGPRPGRDLLLYAPLTLLYLAALVLAVWRTIPGISVWNGVTVGLATLELWSFFDGCALALVLLWLPFALLVRLLAGAAPSGELRAVPLPRLLQGARWTRWVPRPQPMPLGRAGHRWQWRHVAPLVIGMAVVRVLQIVVDVFSAQRSLDFSTASRLARSGAVLFGFTALGLLIVWIPTSYVLAHLGFAIDRVLRALSDVVAGVGERPAPDGSAELDAVLAGREHASGRARPHGDRLLTGPLSGQPCLAYRIAGRAGDSWLDDAEAVDLILEEGARQVALHASRWIVDVPVAPPEPRALDAGQRARLFRLLEARGLSSSLEPTFLAEACLLPGERIEAWGCPATEPGTEEGYRQSGIRKVLCDGDARPVVLRVV